MISIKGIYMREIPVSGLTTANRAIVMGKTAFPKPWNMPGRLVPVPYWRVTWAKTAEDQLLYAGKATELQEYVG